MKKLTCHCGGVEAEVKLPKRGLKNWLDATVQFAKGKAIL